MLQRVKQEFIELAHRGDLHPLVGRMGIADRGAERDHVQFGIGAADHAALQPRMDRHDGRPAAVERLVGGGHRFEDRGVHVGIPAVVAARQLHLGARQFEHSGDRVAQRLLLGIDRTIDRKAMYLSCAPENIFILSFILFIKNSPFFNFFNYIHLLGHLYPPHWIWRKGTVE